MIKIYTDGSCRVNPGPGGWAALIIYEDGRHQEVSGSEDKTTNNRMEQLAAIKALEQISLGAIVTIFSDSNYLIGTMTRGWKRNHNQELWERLDAEVNGRTVIWEWVRGHSGNMGNEFVDDLAAWQAGVRADRPILKEFINARSVLTEDIDQDIPVTTQGDEVQFSHLDVEGNAGMVDIGDKVETNREAIAQGRIVMSPAALTLIDQGGIKKGDVLSVARLAGIMAAKKTADLIPLCHPIPLTHIAVEFQLIHERCSIQITASVRTFSRTGVEMEALMAVSIAALTIYDMAKSIDKTMRIEDIGLKSKRGGKSGDILLR